MKLVNSISSQHKGIEAFCLTEDENHWFVKDTSAIDLFATHLQKIYIPNGFPINLTHPLNELRYEEDHLLASANNGYIVVYEFNKSSLGIKKIIEKEVDVHVSSCSLNRYHNYLAAITSHNKKSFLCIYEFPGMKEILRIPDISGKVLFDENINVFNRSNYQQLTVKYK